MIVGTEQPALATEEYKAEITEGDIGAPIPEPTPEDLIVEAGAAKYGKIRPQSSEPTKKTPPKQTPQPRKPQGNPKNGKK